MAAVIAYGMESWNWGDSSDRNGWYLTRYTIALDATGQANAVVDRFPIAKFETAIEALQFRDTVKADALTVLPDGWRLSDVTKRRAAK